MFRFGDEGGDLKCSFCGKTSDDVRKLIAGPGIHICNECVGLCNEIIEEETLQVSVVRGGPKPLEVDALVSRLGRQMSGAT